MCNPFKAVKKVFKKVVKVAKVILPYVILAAAIYFTAGAALGIAPTATTFVGGLGLGPTLTPIVAGAATQASYGALIGGGLAAVTGGDIEAGILGGAATGAVTGGITGALAPSLFTPTEPPVGGVGTAPSSGAVSGGVPGGGAVTPSGSSSAVGGASATTGGPLNILSAPPAVAPGSTFPATGPVGGVGTAAELAARVAAPQPGVLGFIERNPELIGQAIGGIGQGIGSFAEAEAIKEAAKEEGRVSLELQQAEEDRIAANFSGRGGLLTQSRISPDVGFGRPLPSQQFNAASVLQRSRGAMWRYNPETGQVELTPATA